MITLLKKSSFFLGVSVEQQELGLGLTISGVFLLLQQLVSFSFGDSSSALGLAQQDVFCCSESLSADFISSSRTVETYLSKLKEGDIINRIGSKKEGSWEIINQDEKTNS